MVQYGYIAGAGSACACLCAMSVLTAFDVCVSRRIDLDRRQYGVQLLALPNVQQRTHDQSTVSHLSHIAQCCTRFHYHARRVCVCRVVT